MEFAWLQEVRTLAAIVTQDRPPTLDFHAFVVQLKIADYYCESNKGLEMVCFEEPKVIIAPSTKNIRALQ